MRRAKGCLDTISFLRKAVTNTMLSMQQLSIEGFIENLTELVDMASQAIAIGAVISPERFLQYFAAYHGRAFSASTQLIALDQWDSA